MEIPPIKSLTQASEWLKGRPTDYAMIVLSRLALRTLPTMVDTDHQWLKFYAVSIFRANLVAWASINDQAFEFKGATKFTDAALLEALRRAYDDSLAWHAIASATNALRYVGKDNAAHLFEWVAADGIERNEVIETMIFDASSIQSDFAWLMNNQQMHATAEMTGLRLWLGQIPSGWEDLSAKFKVRLIEADPNYSDWIDWYERRIRGERAAFDIPGDKGRVEDKKILRRLAEATDEDFWGKGHEYVNATLKSWLDEARERVRPRQVHNLQATNASTGPPEAGTATLGIVQNSIDTIALPPQEPTAITYGVNAEGKLDRLPHSDQAKLRDTVDQRRAYDDLRAAALALHDEGQRLGPRLLKAVERLIASLPEAFDDAETYPIWRDANALRRLNRAHIQASKSADPDEAKLEPVIAETLGGVLDLYNHFAFADDGLRAKDEQRISPQERADAEAEAAAARPVIEAILKTPDIATEAALHDLIAEKDQSRLPADDPYAAQAQAQANIMVRNQSSGLLAEVGNALKDKKVMGAAIAGGAAWDGIKYAGSTALASASGVDLSAIVEFIATFAIILQHYVAIAFPTFEHLTELIERIRLHWQNYNSGK